MSLNIMLPGFKRLTLQKVHLSFTDHIMSVHAQRSRSHKEVTAVNRGEKMKIAGPTLAMNKLSSALANNSTGN